MNKYIKNYFLSVSNTLLNVLFPIITFPYVSRVLGPSNLGIINFVQSYGYYFSHIASFGLSSYAIREVSKVRDNKDKTERICNEIFNLNLFFSVISTMLYFCGVLFVQNFRENFGVFVIYSVVIISNFLSLDWLLQSFDDYFFSTIRNIVIRVVSIVAVFVLVKRSEDFIIYSAISCISGMGTKFSTVLYSRRNYVKLRISTKYLNFKDHLKSLFTLFSFRIVNGISSNLDKLMIGFMMVYACVGIYSVGVKFVLLIQPIVETFGIVLFPKINISAGNSKEGYLKNLNLNYELILALGIPMAIGLYLISEWIIPLFAGGKYMDAIIVLKIMSPIILLGPIGDMLGSKILLVFKKDGWLLNSSIIVAISNITLNFMFIPLWGINGAALASTLSCLVAVGIRYYYSRKIISFNLICKKHIKYLLFAIPFVVIYIMFKRIINDSNLWIFVFISICAIIYVAEMLITKDEIAIMIISKMFYSKK